MEPLGYIVMRHTTILSRPVKAYLRWIEKMPSEYGEFVIGEDPKDGRHVSIETDRNLLAHLKDYRSLMPVAQEANKPMFMLKPADGVVGAQQNAVRSCRKDFETLAKTVIQRVKK